MYFNAATAHKLIQIGSFVARNILLVTSSGLKRQNLDFWTASGNVYNIDFLSSSEKIITGSIFGCFFFSVDLDSDADADADAAADVVSRNLNWEKNVPEVSSNFNGPEGEQLRPKVEPIVL